MKTGWGLMGLVLLVVLVSCAKELTQEQLDRESSMRSYHRLVKAQGNFHGYTEIGDGTVPTELIVLVQGNPNDGTKNPELQASLRIGLFGGVTLRSTQAAFDWGASELTVSFGTAKLEFKGIITDTGIDKAILSGPKQGSRNAILKRTALYAAEAQEYFYEMVHSERSDIRALLTIKKSPNDIAAPEDSDMLFWPGLDVSIRFPHLAQTPQTTSKVLYDPLAGTLNIYLTSESRIEASEVSASKERFNSTQELPTSLFLSGVKQADFILKPLDKPLNFKPLPPTSYSGTFSSGPDSPTLRAVAYLEWTGGKITNGLDSPFTTFPEFRFTFYVCDKSLSLAKKEAHNISLYPLLRKMTLTTSGSKNEIETEFDENWENLDGKFLHKSGSGKEPRFHLKSDPKLGVDGCKE